LLEKDPKHDCFRKDEKDIVLFGKRLVVPDNWELKKEILDEGYLSKISIHPGSSKNVSRFKGEFLVVQYEGGHCQICVRMRHLSKN
jgi:hypothetical protein